MLQKLRMTSNKIVWILQKIWIYKKVCLDSIPLLEILLLVPWLCSGSYWVVWAPSADSPCVWWDFLAVGNRNRLSLQQIGCRHILDSSLSFRGSRSVEPLLTLQLYSATCWSRNIHGLSVNRKIFSYSNKQISKPHSYMHKRSSNFWHCFVWDGVGRSHFPRCLVRSSHKI